MLLSAKKQIIVAVSVLLKANSTVFVSPAHISHTDFPKGNATSPLL